MPKIGIALTLLAASVAASFSPEPMTMLKIFGCALVANLLIAWLLYFSDFFDSVHLPAWKWIVYVAIALLTGIGTRIGLIIIEKSQ